MALDPSQVVNNMKKSFNAYIAGGVTPVNVNFDEDPFGASGLDEWYAIRHRGLSSEPVGMGDLIEEDSLQQGRFHVLKCEVSAWHRDDPQRAGLGDMADTLVSLCEAARVTLYDFADPDEPVNIGTMKMRSGNGSFTPVYGGGKASGLVSGSDSEMYAEGRIAGYVMEVELVAVAEI